MSVPPSIWQTESTRPLWIATLDSTGTNSMTSVVSVWVVKKRQGLGRSSLWFMVPIVAVSTTTSPTEGRAGSRCPPIIRTKCWTTL